MTAQFRCQVCTADALAVQNDYRLLPRVTSDAKPWPIGGTLAVCKDCGAIQKLPDEQWLDEIQRIYAAYDMYHLSEGSEQLVFAGPNNVEPRSQRLVEFVLQQAKLPSTGTLLDIGCGNGDALANFSRALPGWRLNGSELTDKMLPTLRKLRNFDTLYTVPPEYIAERFALVVMVHSLEHMTQPGRTLTEAAALLDRGGTLFVEIPDIETSPFDLLVADHLMHFSRATLGSLAARCGLAATTLINDLVPKEITLLAHRSDASMQNSDPQAGLDIAKATLSWLSYTLASARALANDSNIGIFGTSIAGMGLYGALRDRVAFFIDEDPARIGRSYDGKPVLAPADAPARVPVFIALPPDRAQKVVERLAATGMRSVCPPAFPIT